MDFRIGARDGDSVPWPVLTDVTITMVLFLVLFIVVQFLQTYREQAIVSTLRERQQVVSDQIRLASDGLVFVESLSPEHQRLRFNDATLFDVCRATLKTTGASLLARVGAVLQANQGWLETVSVEGHTDRQPTTGSPDCLFPTNWELSSARATAVVALFSRASLVANDKLSAIGRGEFQPVHPDSLARNRRIELSLQYDRKTIESDLRGNRLGSGN